MKIEFWEDFVVKLVAENEQDKAWIFAYTNHVNVDESDKGAHFKYLLQAKNKKNEHTEVDLDYFGDHGNDNSWEELYALAIYPSLVP